MSGPVPSPSMKGRLGWEGTSRRPSGREWMRSPGGMVRVEYGGMRGSLKQKNAGRRKESVPDRAPSSRVPGEPGLREPGGGSRRHPLRHRRPADGVIREDPLGSTLGGELAPAASPWPRPVRLGVRVAETTDDDAPVAVDVPDAPPIATCDRGQYCEHPDTHGRH